MKALIVLSLSLWSLASFGHGDEEHSPEEMKNSTEIITLEESIKNEYRKSIQPIFQAKCFDCHSSSTNYPWYYEIPIVHKMIDSHIGEARSHIDMSDGFPFKSHGTPSKDLEALIVVVDKDKMPPWYYTPFHQGSKLTVGERNMILGWAKESLSKIKKRGKK